ncbi:hypothetical protein RT42_GL002269 [Enterococcus cecorum DSM 20682 = ATCC 43198]|nr:hypothetical protein RT42_GL002269 [Enterococcus cecorum DSM 20682 = ATCC 43198]
MILYHKESEKKIFLSYPHHSKNIGIFVSQFLGKINFFLDVLISFIFKAEQTFVYQQVKLFT